MNTTWIASMQNHDAEIEILLPSLTQGERSFNRIYMYAAKESPVSAESNAVCELVVHTVSELYEHTTAIPVYEGESIFAAMIRGLKRIEEARTELGLGY